MTLVFICLIPATSLQWWTTEEECLAMAHFYCTRYMSYFVSKYSWIFQMYWFLTMSLFLHFYRVSRGESLSPLYMNPEETWNGRKSVNLLWVSLLYRLSNPENLTFHKQSIWAVLTDALALSQDGCATPLKLMTPSLTQIFSLSTSCLLGMWGPCKTTGMYWCFTIKKQNISIFKCLVLSVTFDLNWLM